MRTSQMEDTERVSRVGPNETVLTIHLLRLLLLGGVLIGLAASHLTPGWAQAARVFIPPALIMVLYGVMVRIPLDEGGRGI